MAVLVLLVVGMLILSTGTSGGPEGLAVLVRLLVGVAVVVLIASIFRRTRPS